MINAIKKFYEAIANYNPNTGEGANELLLALVDYEEKMKNFDEALAAVGKILEERKEK
jgi:hypothetical protein